MGEKTILVFHEKCISQINEKLEKGALRLSVAFPAGLGRSRVVARVAEMLLNRYGKKILFVFQHTYNRNSYKEQIKEIYQDDDIETSTTHTLWRRNIDEYSAVMLFDLSADDRAELMKHFLGRNVRTISWFRGIPDTEDQYSSGDNEQPGDIQTDQLLLVMETKSILDVRDVHLADYDETEWLKEQINRETGQTKSEKEKERKRSDKLRERKQKVTAEITSLKARGYANLPNDYRPGQVLGQQLYNDDLNRITTLEDENQKLKRQLEECRSEIAKKDDLLAFMQSIMKAIGIPHDLMIKSFEQIQKARENLSADLQSEDNDVREKAVKQLQDRAAEIVEQLTRNTITIENHQFYEDYLKRALSITVWQKMDARSRSYLITAKSNFETMNKMLDRETFDYSGVCLLMTKALEVEVAKRFFTYYSEYLTRKYRSVSNWPYVLRKQDHGFATDVLIDEKDFTLGSVVPTVGLRRIYASNNLASLDWGSRYSRKEFLDYARNQLFENNDYRFIEREIIRDCEFIERVRVDYRNPSAHRGALTIISAKKCFDYIIDIEHMLREMLEPMKL